MSNVESFVRSPEGVELRPVPGIVGYAAGSDGNIYSFRSRDRRGRRRYTLAARRMVGGLDHQGYNCITLCWRTQKTYRTSRLICGAFHGPCPEGMECSHLNGNKLDNRPDNLCWETKSRNNKRRFEHGALCHKGENSPMSKLTEEQIREIRSLEGAMTQEQIGRKYGVSQSLVSMILSRVVWSHMQ